MEDASHFNKYLQVLDQVKGIKYYVIWKGALPAKIPSELNGRVLLWKDFMALGDSGYIVLYVVTNLKEKKTPSNIEDSFKNQEIVPHLSTPAEPLAPRKLS